MRSPRTPTQGWFHLVSSILTLCFFIRPEYGQILIDAGGLNLSSANAVIAGLQTNQIFLQSTSGNATC